MSHLFNEKCLSKLHEVALGKTGIRLTAAITDTKNREYRLWGENGEMAFEKHSYEIGSLTKTFTGLLIAKAVALGIAKLEDPISRWFSELPQDASCPTVEQLVTHRAGFPSDNESDDETLNTEEVNPFENLTREDLINTLLESKLDAYCHPPAYSNYGAALTGLLAERIYQRSYKDLMTEVFSGLGLTETSIYSSENIGLCGYNPFGERRNNWRWTENCAYAPTGSFVSTAADLLTYGEAILRGDLPYVALAAKPITKFEILNGQNTGIGFFWLSLTDYQIIYHNGATGCFNAVLAIDTAGKRSMVLLCNYHMPDDGGFIIPLLLSMRK